MDPVATKVLECIADGDPEAFRQLFEQTYVSLVQRASFYLMDVAVAEDIVQDTFAQVWSNRQKLRNVGNFEGYILRWVRNECLNYLKHSEIKNKYRHAHMTRETSVVETDPETYYKAIYELIEKMPLKRRQIFEMSVFQSKTYADIAEDTGISINTVKEHIKAAYAYLRKESGHIPYP